MTGSNGSTAVSDQPVLPKPEGLEGVVAASTALSHVLGEEGKLVYRGYDIHELAGRRLVRGSRVPPLEGAPAVTRRADSSAAEVGGAATSAGAGDRRYSDLPAAAAPMDALRTGVSALGTSAGGQLRRRPRSRRGDRADREVSRASWPRSSACGRVWSRSRRRPSTTPRRAISTSSLTASRTRSTGDRLQTSI